ncbi:SDR family NAD(P)-dependent oxidoreductase [Streptomyces olivaceoviridis]|uniref:SDR family oxidoreductase n=1 Tax=Streptomyces olivaceoviridis TaxID=1921 RepID=UPI0033B83F7E
MDLTGKVAVVTGSGRGLGLAYAAELARLRAAVIVNDVDEQVAADAAAGIRAAGGTASHLAAPVGPTATAEALVAHAVETYGQLDIMVCNAGILRDKVLWKMTDADFDAVIDVHLRGTFTCVRAAAIRMKAQGTGGRIITVGSSTGQQGNFGQSNYAAAKAGIVGMVRTWAMELARDKITVNAITPIAATAMTATVPGLKELVAAAAAGEPLPSFARRLLGFGTPQDVAGVVGFLASDEAADVTGQAINIGGDRLGIWSHPHELTRGFNAGGWTAEQIAEDWNTLIAPWHQPIGSTLVLPEMKKPAAPVAEKNNA